MITNAVSGPSRKGLKPSRKVSRGAGIGTVLSVLAASVLGMVGVDVPDEMLAASGSLIASVIAWFTRD